MEKLSEELLPKNISEKDSKAFVDEMAKVVEKNPYFVRFLDKLKDEKFENFEKLSQKVAKEGKDVFPDVVALSYVFEKLTKALYDNPKLLEKCTNTFDGERKKSDAFKNMSFYHKIKFISVDIPIKNIFLKAHQMGKVPSDDGSFMLPLNILEATYANKLKNNEPYIEWDDKKLTRLWGSANLESTKDYKAELTQSRKNHIVKIKDDKKALRSVNMPKANIGKRKEVEEVKNKLLKLNDNGKNKLLCMDRG